MENKDGVKKFYTQEHEDEQTGCEMLGGSRWGNEEFYEEMNETQSKSGV